MSEKIALSDTQRYMRDPFSKGLVSTDVAGLGMYQTQRRKARQIEELELSINTVQTELREIKELLFAALSHRITPIG